MAQPTTGVAMAKKSEQAGLAWRGAALSLMLLASTVSCAAEENQNHQMVPVNLSLIIDNQQASRAVTSRIARFFTSWLSVQPASAQSVSDIATIQVQVSAPDMAVPATASVPVSNPTSGEIIPVQLTAPAGPGRLILVAALDGTGNKIFGGRTVADLSPGVPANIEIRLTPSFTVTVVKQGSGQGTVTSSPAGIACGASCSAPFDSGITVSLVASAAAGSVFAGWSGGTCSGTDGCTVTGTAMVIATFTAAPNTSQLTVVKAGGGSGTVTSSPNGISCGSACTANFSTGSTVVLTATASGGSTFVGWSGGLCTGTGPCTVAMDGDRTVTATFNPPANGATLTVTKMGAGTGSVSSVPAGIDNCTATCNASFPAGTTVTLTATPSGGSTFAGWSGACGGTGPCVVMMTGNQSVTATFNPPASTATLTVVKAGTGTGTVTSTPAGINCGSTCSAQFSSGSVVTLTATAGAGSRFTGWSGGGCSGTGSCSVVMNGNQTVTATFAPGSSTARLIVTKSGSGNGTVRSMPGGINCGNTCTADFPVGTSVTLTADPTGNSTFVAWHAACTGSGACVVLLNSNQEVTVEFGTRGR
ncbi:MAG TPA: hypothetical protein VFS39_02465 [Nitrospira sp.]|nr:hypothetical protein [Nitrospira sp.]